MSGKGMILKLSNILLANTKSSLGRKQIGAGKRLNLFFVCIIMAPMLLCGCSHLNEGFREANDFFSQGSYEASLGKYQQIIEEYPAAGDRVLFEMGIVYAHPG